MILLKGHIVCEVVHVLYELQRDIILTKCSRTYGIAVPIGDASVKCVLLAPVVASLAAAGGDDVGWTGFGGSFVGADFFCFLVSGSSPESSDSTAITAAAAVLLLDTAPALPFLDIDADATP